MSPDRSRRLSAGGFAAFTQGIDISSLWRWVRLSVLVGAVVGLAACGAFWVLEWSEATLLYRIAGHEQPPFGSGTPLVSHGSTASVWWLLALLPAVGGLAAGLLVWRLAPETSGHGTDAMIDAYHRGRGVIRPRVPVIKLFASLLTLGTGGSAGREGPMSQIGAGFGSYVGTALRLTERDRRLLLLAGAAGGISALFRCPLGAALWALEVLYREDFESEGLFPCLVSSVTAYSIFTTVYGQGHLFATSASYPFHPTQLFFYALLALACAPLGLLWIKTFYTAERRVFARMRAPAWLKPAIGGLLLGGLGLALPWIIGSGYGWIQDALRDPGDPLRRLPIGYRGFGLLLGLAVAKMLATSITVGSGGSGGLFFPSLWIGGMIGGAFGLLFHELAPGVVSQPGAFVLVGMGAFYAGVARVPIACIILISELSGSYDLLVPLMLAEMVTVLLLRRFSLYEKQVRNAQASPAHTADFTVDVLEDLRVRDHYTAGRGGEPIAIDAALSDLLERVAATAESTFAVARKDGSLAGVVSLTHVRSVVAESEEFLDTVLVGDAMTPLRTLAPDATLRAALQMFMETGYDALPVVDPAHPDKVLGLLGQGQLIAAYNAELIRRRRGGAGSTSRLPLVRGGDDSLG